MRSIRAWPVMLVLTACASAPAVLEQIPSLENQPRYEVERVALLATSPEMIRWIDQHIQLGDKRKGRAWTLAYAALDPYLLDFTYDPQVTLTAQEAFEQRRGNCLTFSNMFIAMAREAGLDAWYREVNVQPEWNNIDDTMLVSMHVNAAVQESQATYVIDVSRRKQKSVERVRKLSDREAEAQFYNNLGVDALIDNDLAMAYGYFLASIELVPDLAYVWSNLGVVFRRNEQAEDAKLAYRNALEIEPEHSVSLNNLYLIYEEEGDLEAAELMATQVERLRRKNPFYLHYLAQVANEEQRYGDAVGLLNRAIRLDGTEYRFHHTMARSQQLLGNSEKAQSSLDRARRLAPEGFDTASLTLPGDSALPDS